VLPKILFALSMANAHEDISRLICAMDDFKPNPKCRHFQNIWKANPHAVISVWSPNLARMVIKAFGKDFRKALPLLNRLSASTPNTPTSFLRTRTQNILLHSVAYQALLQNDTPFIENLLETILSPSSVHSLSTHRPLFRMLMTDTLKRKKGTNGGADEAISIFNIMVDKFGLKPTVTDWVVYSNAQLRKGNVQEAIDTIKSHILTAKKGIDNEESDFVANESWAKKKNTVPASSVAFSSLIAEYCRRDLNIEAER
jgi:hypothetical protein